MLKFKAVTSGLDKLLMGENKIMSARLKTLLEGLKSELELNSVRRNVKFLTLVRKYRPTASERERSAIRNHILPALGSKTVSQVDVKKFIDLHKGKPMSSAKKILKPFEKIMKLHDPSFQLPKVRYENKGKQWTADQILTEDQVLDVINNYVTPKYRFPCLISAYSGLRLKNAIELKWRDVDFKNGWVNVNQSKTGKPIQVPMNDTLRKILKQVPRNFGEMFFCGLDPKAMSVQVGRSFKRAGLVDHSFHSFRHWYACHAINNGVPLEVVRDLLGHSDYRSTLIYARVKKEKLQEAVKCF
jgi:integrase